MQAANTLIVCILFVIAVYEKIIQTLDVKEASNEYPQCIFLEKCKKKYQYVFVFFFEKKSALYGLLLYGLLLTLHICTLYTVCLEKSVCLSSKLVTFFQPKMFISHITLKTYIVDIN